MTDWRVLSWLLDDGGPCVTVIEEAGKSGRCQALEFRVGPVWMDSALPEDEPAVWVTYQERHLSSGITGPVLIDLATWRRLDKAVRRRARRWRRQRLAARWRRLRQGQ